MFEASLLHDIDFLLCYIRRMDTAPCAGDRQLAYRRWHAFDGMRNYALLSRVSVTGALAFQSLGDFVASLYLCLISAS
jgi:hypothetical protein